MLLLPPSSTLFPYTTLFRSPRLAVRIGDRDVALPERSSGGHCERGADLAGRVHADPADRDVGAEVRSEEHTSELKSLTNLDCLLLLGTIKSDAGDGGQSYQR